MWTVLLLARQPELDVARLDGRCHQTAETGPVGLRFGALGDSGCLGPPEVECRKRDCSCEKCEQRRLSEHMFHAAMLRAAGAMNSGPTGLVTVSRRIRSISALAAAASCHPATSLTGCTCEGWRAPRRARVMPSSSIQRTARCMTRL